MRRYGRAAVVLVAVSIVAGVLFAQTVGYPV